MVEMGRKLKTTSAERTLEARETEKEDRVRGMEDGLGSGANRTVPSKLTLLKIIGSGQIHQCMLFALRMLRIEGIFVDFLIMNKTV